MQKILLLPPFICLAFCYNQEINGMKREDASNQNNTEITAHHDILQKNMETAIDNLVANNPLVLSSIIHSDNANIKPSGYSWSLWLKSFALSKSDLLISTIETDSFEPNNNDHKILLEESLRESLQTKQYNTIVKIVELMHNKHPEKLTISPIISRNIFARLQSIQYKDIIATHNTFNSERKKTLTSLIALSNTFIKQLEHLFNENTQQDKNFEEAINGITTKYKNSFIGTKSISKKYTIPHKEKQLPKKPLSEINNHLLSQMIFITNENIKSMNQHLELMQTNTPLIITIK